MAVASEHVDFQTELARVLERTRAHEPAAVQRLRRAAFDRFAAVGWPSRRDEAWRHTSVAPIASGAFALGSDVGAVPAAAAAAVGALALPGAHLAALIDGRLAPECSRLEELPPGVTVSSLAAALHRTPELVAAHLGSLVGAGSHAFASLNTALFTGGALVHLARGAVLDRPLHLVVTGGGTGPTLVFPRVLVVAEEGSEGTVVETYGSASDAAHCCEAVTELVLAQGARIDHYKLQIQGESSYHVAVQAATLGRDAALVSHAFSFGAALARNDVAARLDGEGASLVLNGLYVPRGSQHVDTHMTVEHARPHGESHELYKGVLDGRATAVFDGLIHVLPGAQKTNAKQSNRNLLLSRQAVATSNPQLRIFADDVKCTHGSTVGELDADALFYLRSRGIGADAARAILTRAFAGEVLAGVRPKALRAAVERLLAERLPEGGALEGVE
jgi:Fe-S cluster assembly protein SufD